MKIHIAPSIALAVAASFCIAHAAKKRTEYQPPDANAPAKPGTVTGWLAWRGPSQNGTSPETGLPDNVDGKKPLWVADFPGQSTPVIAGGKLYINGFVGEGADLREGVSCFDADTGKLLWQHLENDFLSDIIYLRYATSAPAVDPETGSIYVQGAQGLLSCFSADGKVLWQHSLMEEYGRMTFPNGRTATPIVDKELVITRGITGGWGANGAAGDRFLAFDKKTGELVWLSSPASRPQDSTFSPPYFSFLDGKRVFFTACGDSSIACVNARTGDPLFRFPAAKAGAKGGINGGVLRYKDSLIVAHESENVDTSEIGRTAAFRIPSADEQPKAAPPPGVTLPPGLRLFSPSELELWRNPLGNLASSPCLADRTLYEVTGVGEVAAVDVETGRILWKKKIGPEQRQSSPFFADGKLYVAFYIAPGSEGETKAAGDTEVGDGELFVLKPDRNGVKTISHTRLTGRCFGSPIAYNGKLYIQTDKKLYAFGRKGDNAAAKAVVWKKEGWPEKAGEPAKLQIIPNEVLLHPGESTQVRIRALDANGFTVNESVNLKSVKIASYIPPTALVKARMDGAFDDSGRLTADAKPVASAGAFQAVLKFADRELSGIMRGRVLPGLPMKFDFEDFDLTEKTGPGTGNAPAPPGPSAPGKTAPSPGPTNWNVAEPPTSFAYPPLAWNAARFRFDVREAPGGGKALCKTIDNKIFQRAQVFIGRQNMKNYTIEADVLTEGNKRKMSDVGLINQRYLVALRGNGREIEISSNLERIKKTEPFTFTPNEWYHLKVKVEVAKDGSGTVRAKAWKKAEPEPAAWTIELEHKHAHEHGSPGIFSLTPQEQRAWLDNIEVKPN